MAAKKEPISEPVSDFVPDLIIGEPPVVKRGRRTVWTERLERLRTEAPGEWVDATSTWGASPGSVSTIRKLLNESDYKGEAVTRTENGQTNLWIWVE